MINNKKVKLKAKAKLLGVAMDIELRFKKYIVKAAIKGFSTAMYLRRFKMLLLQTIR